MTKAFYLLPFLFVSCSSLNNTNSAANKSVDRNVASLDNNGDVRDDSFDPNLESYFGGNAEAERENIKKVAEIIREFINKQKQVREEHLQQPATEKSERIYKDLPQPTYATRDVHRKTNGCYRASFQVDGGLMDRINSQIQSYKANSQNTETKKLTEVKSPAELGVFTPGQRYDAIVRLSNGNPGNNPDRAPDARGFAVKLLPEHSVNSDKAVAEMSASDLNSSTVLDILSINFPTFFVNDPVKYAFLNKYALEGSRDFKNSLVAFPEQALGLAKLTSLERKLALLTNGSVIYSPLFQQYYSMVPSRLGPEGVVRAVKYSWEPTACSANQQAQFKQEVKTQWPSWVENHSHLLFTAPQVKNLPDDYLRLNAVDRLKKGDFCFNLYMQLYRDSVSTNIEDSTDIWARSEDEKKWWLNQVIPNVLEWPLGADGLTSSRNNYVTKIKSKKLSPGILAGHLTIKQISAQNDETVDAQLGNNNKTCEDLSYNPWNGRIDYHKPLGVVSRMKRKVYNASRRERHQLNGISDKDIERH